MQTRSMRSTGLVAATVALAFAPSAAAAPITAHEFVVSVAGAQEHNATAVNTDWMEGDSCPAEASSSERMTFQTRRPVRLQVHRRQGGGITVVYRQGSGWGNPYPALVDGTVTRDNAGFLACPPEAPRDCGTLAFRSFQVEILGHGTVKRPRWHVQNSADRGRTHFRDCRVARDIERTPAAFPKIFDRRGSDADIRAKFIYTTVPPAKLLNRRVKRFSVTGTHRETYESSGPDTGQTVRFTQTLAYTLTFKRLR